MRNSTDVSTVGRAGETVRYADVSIDYGKLMVCLTARSDFGSAASALINAWHAFSAYCVLFGNNIFGRYISSNLLSDNRIRQTTTDVSSLNTTEPREF